MNSKNFLESISIPMIDMDEVRFIGEIRSFDHTSTEGLTANVVQRDVLLKDGRTFVVYVMEFIESESPQTLEKVH